MSATSQVPPPVRFKGKLDSMARKMLQEIAEAMGMDNVKNTKAVLISFINSSMDRFPSTFQDDPRFIGLYEARSIPKKTRGHKGKNSASKAAEDSKDASKPAEPLTGANLTLFQQGNTTDPRPGFQSLSLKVQGQNLSSLNEQDDSDRSSSLLEPITETDNDIEGDIFESQDGPGLEAPPTPVGDQQEQAEDEQEVPGSAPTSSKKARSTSTVLLRFSHPTEANRPAQQVAVNDASIIKTIFSDGTVKHQVELTKLLPKAIANSSPMKADRAGRFSRPGVHHPEDVMSVGTVAQHLEGTATKLPNLSFQTGNRVTLVDHGDVFGCELFFQPSTHAPATAPIVLNAQSTSAFTGVPPPLTSLTGAGSDLPLEIAQARREVQAQAHENILPKRAQESTPHFLAFLREFAQQDGGLATERNTTAGQARRSNSQFMPFFNKFKVFNTDFVAPAWVTSAGWEQYRNCTFTQLHIISSAKRSSTSTRTNMSLFKKARRIPGDIGDWVKSPLPPPREDSDDSDGHEDESPFETMPLHEFHDMVKEEYEEQQGKKLGKSTGHSKSKKSKGSSSKASSSRTSKRRRSRSRDVESDEDRKRKKKEGKRRQTSANLDDDSNDEQSDSGNEHHTSEHRHTRRRE
ncbi:hypothetical protein C8F04DRAFT_1396610 [Mycena alexandri]|uniref:Uncharacterized protein n=1 Tax=Mycena alexandri TaxID=1745969 RepID=A0AAD6SRK9_9AGAR|nr:hypothetical protein C8F04DRAFT_1396610 [Mycena alexandri]